MRVLVFTIVSCQFTIINASVYNWKYFFNMLIFFFEILCNFTIKPYKLQNPDYFMYCFLLPLDILDITQ